ncbi:MAG: GAF domain-containing sensor histidine kinase [Chloroflexota bacterium]|nr:GAF domain-containing sensor histidine kinase [Chloroflexota bacterium]
MERGADPPPRLRPSRRLSGRGHERRAEPRSRRRRSRHPRDPRRARSRPRHALLPPPARPPGVDRRPRPRVVVTRRPWTRPGPDHMACHRRRPGDLRVYGAKVGALRFGPLVVMPLSARGHAFGILEVSRVRGRQPFEEGDLERVAAFAGQASIALEYARAQRELRRLAVMDDRERIARELHDGAIQSLFAVGMELQATALRASNEKVKSRLQESVDRIDAVIRDLRGYIFGLRPNILEDRTLEQSLEQLGVEFEERSGVLVVSEIDARVAKAMEPIAGEVVQIAREAISNVGRHSGATTCRLSLRRAEGRALLEIADDGTGFDPSTVGPGQGLRDMRERAAALGGSVEIVAAASKGTDVRVSLPVPEAV